LLRGSRETTETPIADSSDDGQVLALQQHRVFCKAGEFLTQFKFEKSGSGGRIRVIFKCTKSASVGNSSCEIYNTTEGDVTGTGEDFTTLEEMPVACENMAALVGFQLKSTGDSKKMFFEYYCCGVKYEDFGLRKAHYTQKQPWTSSFSSLTVHDVFCPEGEAMDFFRLGVEGGKSSFIIACFGGVDPETEKEPAWSQSRGLVWDRISGLWHLTGPDYPLFQATTAEPTEASSAALSTVRVEVTLSRARFMLNRREMPAG